MLKSSTIPPIPITLGCPAGIEPEIIITYFQDTQIAMMMAEDTLRGALAAIHCSLAETPSLISSNRRNRVE